MRYRIRSALIAITAGMLLAILSLFLTTAQPAHAVVQELSSASLRIEISYVRACGGVGVCIYPMGTLVLPWSGTGSADVTATSITDLSAGIFRFTGSIPVNLTAVFPITEFSVVGATNGVGNFSGIDTAFGSGPMAVGGTLNFCLFADCAYPPPANVSVPFTTGGVDGVGLGGAPIGSSGPPGLEVNFTVKGNQWTTGTASIDAGNFGTFSQTGSPLSGCKVKLVTPTVISTSLNNGSVWPSFAIMDLTFIPEPGTALLLGAGVVGLATLGRKRLRR